MFTPHPILSLGDLELIARAVEAIVPPTPVFRWALLAERAGADLYVKHENHTAIGAFKIRGAVHYMARLVLREPSIRGVIAATRGNFGQAVAFAAARHGLTATIVVPFGNSPEKNRAMRALGADLVEHGEDFQASLVRAEEIAKERGYHFVPSFHPDLVAGNTASTLHFLRTAPALDVVYVPIGLGSGICAMIAARDALGLATKIVGVVSDRAPAAALSFEAHRLITHPVTTRIADGMACSTPHPDALAIFERGVDRIVQVTDEEVESAIRALLEDTHNLAEGAGAASLAAVLQDRARVAGRTVGIVLTGGNIDRAVLARVSKAED